MPIAPLLVEERFALETQVGRGAFGEVFRAKDRVTGQPVAIKRLIGAIADPIAAERFDREARLVSLIDSPHVVRYIAHGVDADGTPCLVLEWLEGEDLKRRQQWRPLKVAEAIEVGRQAALGLAGLHDAGIIHRDVKPSNFFLVASRDEALKVVVIDLGTARGDGEAALTVEGWAIGTPAYMSPEQARGEHDVDARSDIFSLGVVLFELICGRRPFRGADNYALLAKIVLEEPPRLSTMISGIAPELEAIVARAMSKRAEARFTSARDFAEALAAVKAAPLPMAMAATEELPTEAVRALGDDNDPTMAQRLPRVSTLQEQRVVTTVFASMRGLPDGRGPDAMRAFTNLVAERAGVAHTTLGARVIGVFGGSRTTGDEVVRAAHTALAAQTALPGVRLAIATGRVQADAEGVAGEAIERAATMLDEAEEVIRIDGPTARMLATRFLVEGEEGASVLVAEREIDDLPQTLLGKQTSCVGRDRELAVLDGIFAECVAERVARVALVTAQSGAGKSRLKREMLRRIAAAYSMPIQLAPAAGAPPSRRTGVTKRSALPSGSIEVPATPRLARADRPAPASSISVRSAPGSAGHGPLVLHGRGDSLGAGTPFGTIAPAIRRAAGIRFADSLEMRRQKLRARIGRRIASPDAARIAGFVGELAGIHFPDDGEALRVARADPMLMGDSVRAAFCDWLRAEATATPVLLILDDLHWGDLPTVRLVDAALRQLRDQPLMVLALARPEVHAHFPGLWSERAVHEVRLGPLGKKASEKLVREVLGDVSEAKMARIVDRSEGNAFYLEELIRAVSEGGGDTVPDTVLGMVQARLDAVGNDGRRVLRAASVFGSSFTRAGVTALVGGDERASMVAQSLEDLSAREVVVPRRAPQPGGETEYSFRHALVREAAYAILTEADRTIGHRLAAEFLEQQGDSPAVTLAQHFQLGGQSSRAATWFLRAAEEALERNDLAGAIERAERGVACAPGAETRGALRLTQAEAHLWRGELERAEERATESATVLPEGTPIWLRAVTGAVDAAGRRGEYTRVTSWVDLVSRSDALQDESPRIECIGRGALHLWDAGDRQAARKAADRASAVLPSSETQRDSSQAWRASLSPGAVAMLHLLRARRELESGDPSAYLAGLAAALRATEQAGDARRACAVRAELGEGYLLLGAWTHAEPALRQSLAAADSLGLPGTAVRALVPLSAVLALAGDADGARRAALRAVEVDEAGHGRRLAGLAHTQLARIELGAGHAEEAVQVAQRASELLAPALPARAVALSVLSSALLAARDLDQALRVARQAVELVDTLFGIDDGETGVRLCEAVALDARGENEGARAALGMTMARLQERANRIRDAGWRNTYLRGVPDHARTLALAAAWGMSPPSSRVAPL